MSVFELFQSDYITLYSQIINLCSYTVNLPSIYIIKYDFLNFVVFKNVNIFDCIFSRTIYSASITLFKAVEQLYLLTVYVNGF